MNFSDTASEVLSWMGSHPVDDALCSVIALIAGVAGVGGYLQYKEHRENRRVVDEILSRTPKVGHVERTTEGGLKYYDPDGNLKFDIPSANPKPSPLPQSKPHSPKNPAATAQIIPWVPR